MPNISAHHIDGLRDLLINNENTPILLKLVKNISKNMCLIEPEAALTFVVEQVGDVHKLLSKKHISKNLLLKYLQARHPGTATDFTKSDLIMRVIEYWDMDKKSDNNGANETEQFPINLFAKQFSEWFYNNLNQTQIQLSDFWIDGALQLRIIADDEVQDVECSSSVDVLNTLVNTKEKFSFIFNLNLTSDGVQGRIDPYGLVIVLSCGTLHTVNQCVGVFESLFGLLRDPFGDNNWKIKKLKLLLRSQNAAHRHTLGASSSLMDALQLPVSNEAVDY
ncbi:uncharacterized protein C3orf38 homolog [Scaptodrosophila lebanonensis]|uniref:Uncharacterized protein C3orf38 homolog n=1 Tax=Drosophila lebanonensis TaxID=7225 RepID=A0A6J2UDS8_DROLE|nr:uncharacterized protein C3orf38 homolog [Scaptodrosophila lebanonensis]